MTNQRSYITGEPLTAGQFEYSSHVARKVDDTFTCATGASYRVLAVLKPQSFGQLILAEEVR
jgi:hypothetical protein